MHGHGADPWWGIAIRLMIEYKNRHLMTSAQHPRSLPPERAYAVNTRGQEKIQFACDASVRSFPRCVQEARGLALRDGVLEKPLYEDAARLFSSKRRPHGCAASGGC